jgi:DNA (cytosine-5)-methyltransferase 1
MNNNFSIIETFVGCGGSHIGFKKHGFNTIFVNDIWDTALKTLKHNNPNLKDEQVICEDINTLCEKDLLTQFNIKQNDLDVLIGGVVCKGFSMAGVRNPYDERNYLYISQLKLVEQFKPKISIIENVTGMKSMKILCKNNYAPVSNKLKKNIEKPKEYICKNINENIENFKLNRGAIFSINRKIELDENNKDLLTHKQNLLKEKENLLKEKKKLQNELDNSLYSVLHDIQERYKELGYRIYVKKIKTSDVGGYTNRIRLIIIAIRNDIKKEWIWGDDKNYNKNNKVKDAFNLLDNKINNPETDIDNRPMKHRPSTIEKFKKITNEKKLEGFYSRGTSNRLSLDKPAPTLVPGHSCFPIHPTQNRSITVREGATITGFPIDYKFIGSHTNRCIQIGNAIPVQLGEYLAIISKNFLS